MALPSGTSLGPYQIGIVKLSRIGLTAPQHARFTIGSSPSSWGSVSRLFVNLTMPRPTIGTIRRRRDAGLPCAQRLGRRKASEYQPLRNTLRDTMAADGSSFRRLDHALRRTEKPLIMHAPQIHSASRHIVVVALSAVVLVAPATAQEFATGEPIGALSEAGAWRPMSDNVMVYGSLRTAE